MFILKFKIDSGHHAEVFASLIHRWGVILLILKILNIITVAKTRMHVPTSSLDEIAITLTDGEMQ